MIFVECVTLVINEFQVLLSGVVAQRLSWAHLRLSLVVRGDVLLISADYYTTSFLSVYWGIIITWLCGLGKVFGCLIHALELLEFGLSHSLTLSLLTLNQASLYGWVLAPCDSCLALRCNLPHLNDIILSLTL